MRVLEPAGAWTSGSRLEGVGRLVRTAKVMNLGTNRPSSLLPAVLAIGRKITVGAGWPTPLSRTLPTTPIISRHIAGSGPSSEIRFPRAAAGLPHYSSAKFAVTTTTEARSWASDHSMGRPARTEFCIVSK